MRIAFQVQGDTTRAEALDAETMWRNPENRTTPRSTDAAVKLASIGVPQEALWEYIGASPTTIARWKKMRNEEAILLTSRAAVPLPPGAREVTAGATPASGQAGATPAPRARGVTPPPTQ
jgi:hypothetical protein